MADQITMFPDARPRYRTILADPPWDERGGGKIKRGADGHYQTLPTTEIPRVMKCSGFWSIAEGAHLWLWVTNNFLQDGFWVMQRLGFRYVNNYAWIKVKDGKLQQGLGQYARQSHELLLFGVRGDAMVPEPAMRPKSVIQAPRTRHSEKPIIVYDLIERVSPGPRVEFFARKTRPCWDSFGNEVEDGSGQENQA